MDWHEYQRVCDRPDVWTRWMLEQTRELLRGAGGIAAATSAAAPLDAALGQQPLRKPAGHRGPAATDVFELTLTRAQVAAICTLIDAAVAAGQRTPATRTRGLGGFREAWQEYLRYADG